MSDDFVKHDSDKPRTDLLDPAVLLEVSEVLAYGANKYSASNWKKGAAWSRYYGAALRHLFAWWRGEDNDPETGYHHIAHAICCLMFALAYVRRRLGTDDRESVGPSKRCPVCDGAGGLTLAEEESGLYRCCSNCSGTGKVEDERGTR